MRPAEKLLCYYKPLQTNSYSQVKGFILACTQHQMGGVWCIRAIQKTDKILFCVTDASGTPCREKQATHPSNAIQTFDPLSSWCLLLKAALEVLSFRAGSSHFNQLRYSPLVNSAAKKAWQQTQVAVEADMRSSINHVVVLVVFFSSQKTRSHLPPAFTCHFTRSSAWARHTKNDICIGLHGGKLAYCSCLLSLLHSFLSVTQFF